MIIQNFLNRLMEGDTKAFVMLALLVFISFLITRFLKRIFGPYRFFLKLLYQVGILFLIYAMVVDFDKVVDVFHALVNWITRIIERVLDDGSSGGLPHLD